VRAFLVAGSVGRMMEPEPESGVIPSEVLERMSENTDWDLANRARSGDMAAFEELVRRYQTPVIHFCRRMVASQQDAEDIAQEVFIRMYRHLGRMERKAKFSTFLFGIARNTTLNFIRDGKRRGRGATEPLDSEDRSGHVIDDAARRPDREAGLHELEELLDRAMAMLSPEHREVLVLREINGLDYSAIARVVRRRKGTVKSRIARAREQLRAHIGALGGDLL
jgi:RNA polymerase sigma-70 factor, ECF subfamily